MSYKNNNDKKDNKSFDHFKENNDSEKENLIHDEKIQTYRDKLNKKHQIYFPNKFNHSAGNFRPILTKEIENMVKELKIDSANPKISNDDQENILIAVIHCLLH